MTPEKDIKMENISDDEVEEDIEDEESNIEQESNKMQDAQVMEVKPQHAADVEMQTPADLAEKFTRQKPHTCYICDATYTRRFDLTTHIRSKCKKNNSKME